MCTFSEIAAYLTFLATRSNAVKPAIFIDTVAQGADRPVTVDITENGSDGWPHGNAGSIFGLDRFEFLIRVDLREMTVSIVRALEWGSTPVSQVVVWTRDFDVIDGASDAYETLIAHEADLGHWNVGAMVFGDGWLERRLRPLVAAFTESRNEARALQLKQEAEARQKAEEEANAARVRTR